ncbi:hypothetical protein [Nonomuraea aridisoli]|uniref:hypothetical protein n=1 Tax=Nonomuraea aridisoli TaxID=2070368 RepID=UPI0011B93A4E|nr:hypothetical protein [Nonomuraea aridisoli]
MNDVVYVLVTLCVAAIAGVVCGLAVGVMGAHPLEAFKTGGVAFCGLATIGLSILTILRKRA